MLGLTGNIDAFALSTSPILASLNQIIPKIPSEINHMLKPSYDTINNYYNETSVIKDDNELLYEEQTNSLVQLDIVGLRTGANYNKNIYNSGNSIDGDLSTKWSVGGEQWIEADLGSQQLVKRIDIQLQPGNDSRNASFEIQVINDGAGTTSILGVESIGDSQIQVNDPIGLDANRVKLYAHNISRNDWNSMLEIKVWGNKITNDPSILIHSLTPFESRTIIPIQMQLPDGKWSKPIKYNFDSGAELGN